jgi:hypothetical protein
MRELRPRGSGVRAAGIRWWDWLMIAGIGFAALGAAVELWDAWLPGFCAYAVGAWGYCHLRLIASKPRPATEGAPADPQNAEATDDTA